MFRTRRQGRYLKLRGVGLLPFEAKSLSRWVVPWKTPYLKELVTERRKDFTLLKEGRISQAEYERRILQRYVAGRWFKRDWRGKAVADPWRMLTDFEERWRQKFPAYESPWEGTRKRFKDFMQIIERDLTERRGYLKP